MGIFDAMDVSASALQAGRARLDAITENIANVETTRTGDGGPYRRQQVVLSTVSVGGEGGASSLVGVRVAGIQPDASPLRRVYNPSHPDADADGYVLMPNVDLPTEMADMVLAARAYEANAAAFRAGRDSVRQALSMLA